MKKIILLGFCLVFFATTFQSHNPPGWYQQPLPVNKLITDIFFLDSLKGWAVTSWNPQFDTGYVLSTTNSGNVWEIQYQAHISFESIEFIDDSIGYIGGGDGFSKIIKTTNGGNNWFLLTPTPGQLIRDIFFVNKDTGWVCDYSLGQGGLWKTTNGGGNWVQQLDFTYFPKRLHFLNADTGWAVSDHLQGRLYRTINGGTNWDLQYIFPSGLGDVYFFNENRGIVSSGRFYNTTDGGFTWIPSESTTTGGKIGFASDSVGWAGYNLIYIPKTTDGGLTWGLQTTNANNPSVSAYDSLIAWAGGNKMMHTTDGGGPILNVQQISTEIPEGFALHQNYPNPFNPTTKINYELRITSYVTLKVFDITGKEIAELVNAKQSTGIYQYTFDGAGLPSGIYFYQLTAESEKDEKFIETRKMVLQK